MKRTSFLSAFLVAVVGFTACTDNTPSYLVEGEVSLTNNTLIYMSDASSNQLIDSTEVVNNTFAFTGSVEHPLEVVVKIDDSRYSQFILENGHITLDLDQHIGKGSYLNDEKLLFNKTMAGFRDQLTQKENELQLKHEGSSDETAVGKELLKFNKEVLEPQRKEFILNFLKKHNNSLLGVDPLRGLFARSTPQEMEGYLALAGPQLLEHEVIANLAKGNEAEVTTAVGKPFIDFNVQNRAGETVALADYIGQGKYVLVDFWASWCGPCLAELANLVEIYAKYQSDQFEIVGVAVLDKPEATLEVINKLALPWTQLLNAQNLPFELYGIKRIPYIMLIGPDGTILHRDLRGDEITSVLDELLGK